MKSKSTLSDQLKKLGLRVRPRTVSPASEQHKPGYVAFDDRGNAERARPRALGHPGLSLMEDEPAPNAPIRNNPKGLRAGYNPYESGLLAKKEVRKKRDLRELSKWIETKKKLEQEK
jgi:hypothetical protein